MTVHCRTITTFTPDGRIDEDAFRAFHQRLVDADLGVYIGACGPCEGFTLSHNEIRRIYELGVEVCKGKVFVGGNGAEQHTALNTLEIAKIGIDTDVDTVNLYGPAGWHGYVPTDAEYLTYFDHLLPDVQYPVALAPNPILGYVPPAHVIADICNRYSQVVSVNLAGMTNDMYLVELRDHLQRDVETYVPFPTAFSAFALGATGLNAYHANVIPKTYRQFLDLYAAGDIAAAADVYVSIRRLEDFALDPAWSYRWVKIAMRVLNLPGGEGGLREPFLMPDAATLETFTAKLLALNIPEVAEMAAEAGLVARSPSDAMASA
jgi:4-hydroxy-tetrahydrodipicolinate synthase